MSTLSAQAKSKIAHLYAMTAQAYGSVPGEMYVATPSVAQTLNDKIIEDGNWFLQLINTLAVTETSGEKVLMGLSGNVASRTNTSGAAERVAKSLVDLNAAPYTLKQTNSDVALRYSTIDAWAKFKNFRERYNTAVRKAIGNDRIKVGFAGTSAAADTVAADLSDVNIGWLEIIRTYNAGSQYVLGGAKGAAGAVTLGGTNTSIGEFANLDSLVHHAVDMLEVPFREDPDLVVLLGRGVMQYAKGQYYDANGNVAAEKQVINNRLTMDTYAGLPAYVPPYFDPDSILVTSFNNLSVYWQESSWRRQQIDNPKKDQYEDFNARNEGYVVEQEGKTALIQGITYL